MNKSSYQRIIYVILIFLYFFSSAHSQLKWHNPLKVNYPVVQNYGFERSDEYLYGRLPCKAKKIVSTSVWNLACQSAGLAIHFYTNSPQICVRYMVSDPLSFPHMPLTGVTGVDLYCIDNDGKWYYCFGGYSLKDTVIYSYSRFPQNKYHDKGYEFRLYLPLYNRVKWMEIGVLDTYDLTFIPASDEKPIVLYGTSITQGACASRSAMAWSTILQRTLDYPLVNLGFSGKGTMDKELIGLIGNINARLYILDCLPNLYDLSRNDLIDRLVSCVKKLREKSSVPILMLEHAGSSNMEMDTLQYSYVANVNAGSREAYEQLSAEGIPEIYYLSREELNLSMDSWVDLVHPNDFGMSQYANVVEMKVRDILNIPSSTSSTTCPVTQRRCVDYGWLDRHLKIVDLVCKKKPKAIILGNSITHYWGGDPSCDIKNGSECWEKEMNPRGYLNLGCAWDRIENLLWRVYHGELEGYEAEKIVVMIGINNVGLDSEEDIVKGIKFLLSEIRVRQPKADIKVVGLLPCRNQEHQVKSINKQLKRIAERDAYFYSDPGRLLLLDNGCIDECLFTDGTHLNEKGYNRIVKELISFE